MSDEAASDRPTDARERLRQHFLHPSNTHTDRWDALWAKGDFLPFDRGAPNPALEDTLRDRRELLGGPLTDDGTSGGKGQRKKALVPGCGRGYDVLLLSSFGYDAYGLEASANAVKACKEYAEKEDAKYPVRNEETGRGAVRFLYGDFFKDDWVREIGDGNEVKFDLIYDYTFLCALPLDLRPAWSSRMSQLLAPSGRLVCLEFPTYKPPSTGGPPFGLPPNVYLQHLTRPGEPVPYDEEGYVKDLPLKYTKTALERIAHWQPERTHEIGKGTDWVSVWQHR